MQCEQARRHSTTLSKVAVGILGFGSSSTTWGETGGAKASATFSLGYLLTARTFCFLSGLASIRRRLKGQRRTGWALLRQMAFATASL
jgi:hypothetical protein